MAGNRPDPYSSAVSRARSCERCDEASSRRLSSTGRRSRALKPWRSRRADWLVPLNRCFDPGGYPDLGAVTSWRDRRADR